MKAATPWGAKAATPWGVAVAAVLYAGAGVAGWAAGWGFGQRAGGTWVAVVAGVNSALFCTLMADEFISRWRSRARDRVAVSTSSSGRTGDCSG